MTNKRPLSVSNLAARSRSQCSAAAQAERRLAPPIDQKKNYLLDQISTKRAITPLSFEQIEKLRCLKLSPAQGPLPPALKIHVSCVACPQTCLKARENRYRIV